MGKCAKYVGDLIKTLTDIRALKVMNKCQIFTHIRGPKVRKMCKNFNHKTYCQQKLWPKTGQQEEPWEDNTNIFLCTAIYFIQSIFLLFHVL
jgi:hypothetical protein